MERERFGVRSFQGPRTLGGILQAIFSDTGYCDRDIATHIHGYLPFLDPTRAHVYFNDFNSYTVGDWTITTTEAGGGDATEALVAGDGGLLLVTCDAADNDNDFFQLPVAGFTYVAGKPMGFATCFKVSDATQSDFVFGLQALDTAPLDVDDGIFFQKDDGDALLDFHVEKNGTPSNATGIATVANNTFLSVEWVYDGETKIWYAVNGVVLGSVALTNVPDDVDLTVSFGLQNGEAVAKTMTVDYLLAWKLR